jgi:hypothetical protein
VGDTFSVHQWGGLHNELEGDGALSADRWRPSWRATVQPGQAVVLPPGAVHETCNVPAPDAAAAASEEEEGDDDDDDDGVVAGGEGPRDDDSECGVSITHQFTGPAASHYLRRQMPVLLLGRGMDECVDMWAPLVLLDWPLAVAHEQLAAVHAASRENAAPEQRQPMCLWNLMNDLRSGGGVACEWLALGGGADGDGHDHGGDGAPSAVLVRWLELRWEELDRRSWIGLEQPVGRQTMTAAQLSMALKNDRGDGEEGANMAHGMSLGYDADDMVYFHDTNVDGVISFEEVLSSWQMFMCASHTPRPSTDCHSPRCLPVPHRLTLTRCAHAPTAGLLPPHTAARSSSSGRWPASKTEAGDDTLPSVKAATVVGSSWQSGYQPVPQSREVGTIGYVRDTYSAVSTE